MVAAIEQATGAPPAGADRTTAMEGLRKEGSGGYVLLLDQFEEIFSGFPGELAAAHAVLPVARPRARAELHVATPDRHPQRLHRQPGPVPAPDPR